MGILLIFIIGLLLACFPSFVIWCLVCKYLPNRYPLSSLWMTAVCMILAFLTATILNFELEMGMLSLFFLILLLMLGWTLMLLLIGITIRLYYKKGDENA